MPYLHREPVWSARARAFTLPFNTSFASFFLTLYLSSVMRYSILLPCCLLLGCASTERPAADAPSSTPVVATSRAFDVPALLGLSAKEIARPLAGLSMQPEQTQVASNMPSDSTSTATAAPSPSEAQATYWKDSVGLVVNYSPQTMQVNNYFLKTRRGTISD